MIGMGSVRRACCSLLRPSGVRLRRGLRVVRSGRLGGFFLVNLDSGIGSMLDVLGGDLLSYLVGN